MRIQHNIMAMNAYRNYNNNTSALSKNLERLSSGYKINRAGDDAAGLAISEKMRAQITGLDAAQKNVKDGISLVSTAEGAMQEVQDMLNRMVYLATQSSNGTYDNEVDRKNLQQEVDQLKSEINRIADSANFNGIKLLDGSLEKGGVQGATYTSVSQEDIVKMLKANLVEEENQTNAVDGKTYLEKESGGAQPASFEIDLGKLHFSGDQPFALSIAGQDMEFVDVTDGMSAKELAEKIAEANKTFPTKDAKGNDVVFDVTAKDGVLTFKGKDAVDFDPSGKVDFAKPAATAGQPTIYGGGTVEVKTVTVNADNGYSLDNISTTPIGKNDAVTNLDSIAQDTSASNAGAISEGKLMALAKKYNASGDVTLQVDETDKFMYICIGGTKVAKSSAAVATTAIDNTNGKTFTFTDINDNASTIGKIKFTATSDTATVNPTELLGQTFDLGMSIAEGEPGSVKASVGKDKLLDATGAEVTNTEMSNLSTALAAKGATDKATGDVKLAYDAVNDTWALNFTDDTGAAATQAVEIEQDANDPTKWYVYNGNTHDETTRLMTLTVSDGLAEEDLQRAYGGDGQKVASLGAPDGTVSGSVNAAVQNIKIGQSEASEQLAHTTLDLGEYFAQDGNKITIGDTTYTVALGKDSKFAGGENVIDLTSLTGEEKDFAQKAAIALTNAAADNKVFTVGHDGTGKSTFKQRDHSTDMETVEDMAKYFGFQKADAASIAAASTGKELVLQIGDTSESFNQLAVGIKDMHVESLGIADINIGTPEGAQAAINTIKEAINTVSSVRGNLGAISNRLDHTANNLSVMRENITDAESAIRDTDIAEEMMSYTKNNILVQSAQAMLAQANQVPQGVLQLLQ